MPYAAADFQAGLALPAASALLGTVAAFYLHETGCKNVWVAGSVQTAR